MKITGVESLAIPDLLVIKFGRFTDFRGYFTETFRKSDYKNSPDIQFLDHIDFAQANESFSRKGVIRGLHFQWNPLMGKMVRTIRGHMIDLALDIRKNSPTLGKIIAYDMPSAFEHEGGEWIWVPPGFAHGNLFMEETVIEYFCTGEYSPGCEAGISPLAEDIDWSLCDPELKRIFDAEASKTEYMTDKDRYGYCLEAWLETPDADQFIYGNLT
ncbi:MAG: dTDP-4-dehydrorhamnose 3,5-epimerase family protein [Desulfobacterales bacterium]|nr:dTDP-4-dehydrorhamnose 3,5-epimerase family protein [Desulfobacterales bacterium]